MIMIMIMIIVHAIFCRDAVKGTRNISAWAIGQRPTSFIRERISQLGSTFPLLPDLLGGRLDLRRDRFRLSSLPRDVGWVGSIRSFIESCRLTGGARRRS